MEMMLWNMALSAAVAVMGFLIKGRFDELDRLGILLNRTREEVAREHITRAEVRADLEKIREHFDDSFRRIEAKIDELARKDFK